MLPTTIAPRYGDPEAAGFQPHQVPTASLLVDYPLDIAISVEGELAHAILSSPSHAIAFERFDSSVVVQLNRKAYLDRDFILILQSETAQSSCVLTADREGYVALASLRIPQLKNATQLPLALKVAIDCSGSMAGSSINQARKAALEILNLLRPHDYFNITLFGDRQSHLFPTLVSASVQNITAASDKLARLDADMGGTEMENALKAVFAMRGVKENSTVLLITDGEIYEHEKLVDRARESAHCVFTVGVGNAVNEVFLHALADATGGACELVSPQEGMAERVVMQFHRMRQPKLGALCVEWPGMPKWQTPLPKAVFAGDTVQVFAGFLQPVKGEVSLAIVGSNSVISPIVSIHNAELPRVAAAQRLRLASETEELKLALDYQLLSKRTNYLVIAERADKTDDLPELHHVPQMLAAGWGGVGDSSMLHAARSTVNYCELDGPTLMRSARRAAVDTTGKSGVDTYDIPSFLRKQENSTGPENSVMATIKSNFAKSTLSGPAKFISNFANHYSSFLGLTELPNSIAELVAIEIDEEMACALRVMVASGYDEAEVIAAFIYALSESTIGNKFSRSFKRTILKHWKNVVKNHDIDAEMKEALAMVTLESWNWQFQTAEG
ncbi:MAG: VWA domain-containing protein [Gallionella sp.]|nr:VWA domain-containing protein [Gallionella sp.]